MLTSLSSLKKSFTAYCAKLMSKKQQQRCMTAAHYHANDLNINLKNVSRGAKQTCEVLQKNGFDAYVVGGAVRDLALGITPKDFDVATNARPEQVKKLFRRAFIIGRRFQLVHAILGKETIEISTFRSQNLRAPTDEEGRILHDNIFGTQAEDATRRDFTINALYLDPIHGDVFDFHQGVSDLNQRILRIIGNPETRYREDPVRMLRAIRLSAKLNLSIDNQTQAPISNLSGLIENVPPARIFDETYKLLMSGNAYKAITQLAQKNIRVGLLNIIESSLGNEQDQAFIKDALGKADQKIKSNHYVSTSFLLAVLLWPTVKQCWQHQTGKLSISSLFEAAIEVSNRCKVYLAIPNRVTSKIKEIWLMQARFEKRIGKTPYHLIGHRHFQIGLEFLVLRCAHQEVPAELTDWWSSFQKGDKDTRSELIEQVKKNCLAHPKRKRKKPQPKKPDAQH